MKEIFNLLYNYSFKFYRANFLKIVIAIFSMAIGLAVFLSIKISNDVAVRGFESSFENFIKERTLRVGSNVTHDLFLKLKQSKYFKLVNPRYEKDVFAIKTNGDKKLFRLYAYDLLSEKVNSVSHKDKKKQNALLQPGTCLISSTFDLDFTDSISLIINSKIRKLKISNKIESENSFIILDIANYQELFEEFNQIDYIDIEIKKNINLNFAKKEIEKIVGKAYVVNDKYELVKHKLQLTKSFRLNLQFLSTISLFIAILLLYNLSTYLIVSRRKDIGTLIALGLSKKKIAILVLIENIVLGLISAILALPIGFLLSSFSIRFVNTTINSLYTYTLPTSGSLGYENLLIVFLLSILVSLLGSLESIFYSFKVEPYENIRFFTYNLKYKKKISIFFYIGVFLTLFSLSFMQVKYLNNNIWMFLMLFILILGILFICPSVLLLISHLCKKFFSKIFSYHTLLADAEIKINIFRSSIVVMGVVLSLGMFFGLSVMITSFRTTVVTWLNKVTPADLYISAPSTRENKNDSYISIQIFNFLENNKKVKAVYPIYESKVKFKDNFVNLQGFSFSQSSINFLNYSNSNGAFISEPFSNKHNVKIGDVLTFYYQSKKYEEKVGAIFQDYSSEEGSIAIDLKKYEQIFLKDKPRGLAVYLKDKSNTNVLSQILKSEYSTYNFKIKNNKELRNGALKVFDETFKITYAMQIISIFLSLAVVLNYFLIMYIEKRRQLAILKAIGCDFRSSLVSTLFECFTLSITSILMSFLLGFLLSYVLVFHVNKIFFGWSIEYNFPFKLWLYTAFLFIIFSSITSLLPVLKNRNKNITRYLRNV